jgi:hypothetical protein
MALALALGLPPEVPQREKIVTISFAVVAFSVVRSRTDDGAISPEGRRDSTVMLQTRE